MKYKQYILMTGMSLFICFFQIFQATGKCCGEQDVVKRPSVNHVQNAATQNEDADDLEEDEPPPPPPVYDPLMPYNRFMTKVNDKFYFWALKPAAQGYSKVVPEPVRLAISRFFDNLYFPVRGVNNLLQLKYKRAGIEAARFGINTTVGILGFFDPAKIRWDMDAYPEDFGQTLGYHNMDSGFPIVLPFLGPSNLRDAVAKIPDIFLNPLYYIPSNEAGWALYGENKLNDVSLHIGDYETIRNASLDLYISLRNAYEANRKKQIGQ